VRSMQLGGLYHNDAPGRWGELVKTLNEIRGQPGTLGQKFARPTFLSL
jgi:hypothetical protein